ncbi:MAG: tRNA 2-thiouridine(34) synthase MnmA [Deltaproteobacteria bacterium]|nr:tRNA 2-thiouridine(34) synthase MnmA [Deltaproteobacteria bacterium]
MSRERIVVAMSGGVDSSTAAAVLCEAGYDVVGVTLKLYNAAGTAASIGGRCCSPRDIEDARATAAQLGFPHYVLDEVEAFKEAVIDDFVEEYRAGRTPNPCVKCNEKIKFGPLVAFANAVGASKLATGHYARLQNTPSGTRLLRAVDHDKDQSYFLFGVRAEVFNQVLFPLGELRKEQTREYARRFGLPNCDKPDSQQLCFVPDGDHKSFVEQRGGGRAGVVVGEEGQTLATHNGTHHFTIGQRKGLPGVDGKKRFVLRIDPNTGTVYTGPRDQLGRTEVRVENVRWLVDVPAEGTQAAVQIRHHSQAHPAHVQAAGPGLVNVRFDAPAEGVAPGQAAVFYKDDVVLGGGWIAPGVGVPAPSNDAAAAGPATAI